MNSAQSKSPFPPAPQSVEALEDALSTPNEKVIAAMGKLKGDIIILGVGGKMGPTLARMAKRASDEAGKTRRVIGVSRFSDADARSRLESWGVETIACDLLDEEAILTLPEAPNVVFMAGFKFGSSGAAAMTWAMNCYLPALVSRKFSNSRIAAFSTGNVYGMSTVGDGGSKETDETNPVGEYAITALGRERMFEYFSQKLNIPTAILRLNYAHELRYGVLVDLAELVLAEQPIDISMSYANVIWQADANGMTLQSLAHAATPPLVVNLAGPGILRTRDVCEQFGQLMNKQVQFTGEESPDALLSDGRKGHDLFGRPNVSEANIIQWVADWVMRGGESLGKPTHFQSRDGKF